VRVYIVCECVWVLVVRGCLRSHVLFFFPMCQSRPDLILKPHNDLEALALAELAKSPRYLFVLFLVQFLQASCWLCGCIYVRLCLCLSLYFGSVKASFAENGHFSVVCTLNTDTYAYMYADSIAHR